jgi:uncharacterized coiled-coil protein SlyX
LAIIAVATPTFDKYLNDRIQEKDKTITDQDILLKEQQGLIAHQQSTIKSQQNELEIKDNLLKDKTQSKCPWQSALHNPKLTDKYAISVSYKCTVSVDTVIPESNQWIHEYNVDFYYYPDDAIKYLKTLKPLSDGTYLIDVSIINNSEDAIEEYQQTTFRFPQDAINYLEQLNICQ